MTKTEYNQENTQTAANQCEGPAGCQSYEFCNIDPTGGNKCLGCTENCITCLSKTNCTQCADDSSKVNGVCIKCNTIVDGQACQCNNQKIVNCTKCTRNGCGSCISDYFVNDEDKCSKQACSENILCLTGQYCQIIPNGRNTCQACSSGCDKCDSTTCSECSAGFKLITGSCLKNECDDTNPCIGAQFCEITDSQPNKCVQCSANCSKCSTSQVCEVCENNFYNNSENGMQICLPCSDVIDQSCACGVKEIKGCVKCGVDSCEQCSSDKYFLQAGICIGQCISNDECPNDQICNMDPSAVNVCVNCKEGCLKCTTLTQCDLCASGQFSIDGSCQDCSVIGIGDSCQCDDKLIQNCSKCGLSGTCEACAETFILVDGECILGECNDITPCKIGQYCQIIDQTIPNKCISCGLGCLSCNQQTCSVCQEQFKLINGQCIENQCDAVKLCINGQFCEIVTNKENRCIKCRLGCVKCNEYSCQECDFGYKLVNAQCVKNICDDKIQCQIGQFCQITPNVPNKCTKCDQGCNECDSSACLNCISDYKLINQQCVKDECNKIIPCKIGQYCQINDKIQNQCIQCQINCSNCDSKKCQQCLVGYKLINLQCLKNDCDDTKTCQPGFFCLIQDNIVNTCNDCNLFPDKCESQRTNLIPIIAGVASGVVVLLIVLIIIIVVIKKRKSHKKYQQRNNNMLRSNQSSSNMTNGSQIYM